MDVNGCEWSYTQLISGLRRLCWIASWMRQWVTKTMWCWMGGSIWRVSRGRLILWGWEWVKIQDPGGPPFSSIFIIYMYSQSNSWGNVDSYPNGEYSLTNSIFPYRLVRRKSESHCAQNNIPPLNYICPPVVQYFIVGLPIKKWSFSIVMLVYVYIYIYIICIYIYIYLYIWLFNIEIIRSRSYHSTFPSCPVHRLAAP